FIGRVAVGHDFLHQLERAGNDGAAGLPGVEEFFLVDLAGAGVVADEYHLDAIVVSLEEQVEQDEEALGDVLGGLGHGAGDVHQAEHHRLGAGVGCLTSRLYLRSKVSRKGRRLMRALRRSISASVAWISVKLSGSSTFRRA